jgi:hypothetical protein
MEITCRYFNYICEIWKQCWIKSRICVVQSQFTKLYGLISFEYWINSPSDDCVVSQCQSMLILRRYFSNIWIEFWNWSKLTSISCETYSQDTILKLIENSNIVESNGKYISTFCQNHCPCISRSNLNNVIILKWHFNRRCNWC